MSSPSTRSGIDTSHLDRAVRPQDDLFRHVNGSWLATAKIPEDRSVYGAFHILRDDAELEVRAIVEAAAADQHAAAGSERRKVGDLYRSFMDEAAIEARGAEPIAADLELVAGIADLPQFFAALGSLQRAGVGGMFGAWVNGDAKQADQYVLYLSQGGLGLPDESYYREECFAAVREAYLGHLERLMGLAGLDSPADRAGRIFALETQLAGSHWDRVSNRDATRTYNKLTRPELETLAPELDWATWIAALGAEPAHFGSVVVRQPSFFTGLGGMLTQLPLADWKAWLAWQVVHSAAPLLSSAFVAENFDFYGRTLTGAPALRERWKRGVGVVEGTLGEALGKLYVAEHFPPAAKQRMAELVEHLVEAYRVSIGGLAWMGEQTRTRALEKLDSFTPKIGYPDQWRDYSQLEITPDDLIGNLRRAAEAELRRDLDRLGGPVDRTEWFMTPQTVNAYYNPLMNEIVFPAAILRPPFFELEFDDAVNYGAIGP